MAETVLLDRRVRLHRQACGAETAERGLRCARHPSAAGPGRRGARRRCAAPDRQAPATLTFVQADLESDAGWADAMAGVVGRGPHRLALSDRAAEGPARPDPPGGRRHRPGAEGGRCGGGDAGGPDLIHRGGGELKPSPTPAGRGGLVRHPPAVDHALRQVEDPGRTRRLGDGQGARAEADHDQPRLCPWAAAGRTLWLVPRPGRTVPEGQGPDAAAHRPCRSSMSATWPRCTCARCSGPRRRASATSPAAGSMALVDMGRTLKAAYPTRRIPTREAPKAVAAACWRCSIRRSGRSCRSLAIWNGCRTPAP